MQRPCIRRPDVDDGPRVHAFVAACPPLDRNSRYCTLLQCTHFAETCALAEMDGAIVGWLGGHLVPGMPDVLFVWQVAVASSMRGRTLAPALVMDVLGRSVCRDVRHVQASVTEANVSSARMFARLADGLGAPVERVPWFDGLAHLGDPAATEYLLRIGPFDVRHAPTREVG